MQRGRLVARMMTANLNLFGVFLHYSREPFSQPIHRQPSKQDGGSSSSSNAQRRGGAVRRRKRGGNKVCRTVAAGRDCSLEAGLWRKQGLLMIGESVRTGMEARVCAERIEVV